MLNSASRNRSAVGRIACDLGAASARPRKRPPTMRISAARRARRARRPRRAGGPAFFPPPRSLGLPEAPGTAGGALAFAFASRGGARRRGRRRAGGDRGGEARPRHGDDARAELLAQGPRLNL